MAQPAVLIDLGYPDEVLPPAPPRAGPPRRWWAAAAGLAMLVPAAFTADVGVPVLTPVLTAPVGAGGIQLTTDALYSLSGQPPSDVAAFGLADGRLRWTVDREAESLAVTPSGPVVLVGGQYCTSPDTYLTTAVGSGDGAPAWRRQGVPVLTTPGGRTVVFKRPADATACARMGQGLSPAESGASVVWDGVDLATGTARWSLPVPVGTHVEAAYDDAGTVPWLAEVAGDDMVTTRDTATGRQLAVARLDEIATGPVVDPYEIPLQVVPQGVTPLSAVGQLVITQRRTSLDGAFDVSGYAHDTLRRLWRTHLSAPPRQQLAGYYTAAACGPSICLGNGADLVVLDARTGAVRRRSGGVYVGGYGRYAVLALPDRDGTPRYRVISGVTGRTVADLGAWQLETTLTTTNPATWALNGPAGGGLLLSLYSGGQTWFQLLDVATMRSALLGVVPGRYSYCSAAGRYLACAGNGGLVHVWRRSGTS